MYKRITPYLAAGVCLVAAIVALALGLDGAALLAMFLATACLLFDAALTIRSRHAPIRQLTPAELQQGEETSSLSYWYRLENIHHDD